MQLVKSLLLMSLCWFSVSTIHAKTESQLNQIKLTTAEIQPYQYLDEFNKLNGFAIPKVTCVMEKLGYKPKIEVLPWARAQKLVEQKQADAFFVASKNSARDQYATISDPLFSGTRSWFIRSNLQINAESEAFKESGIVGTVFGTNMHSKLEDNYKNVVTKNTEAELIKLLKLGRLDALLLTDLMFEYTSEQMNIDSKMFTRQVSDQNPLGIYFGHHFLETRDNFLSTFNTTLKLCVEH